MNWNDGTFSFGIDAGVSDQCDRWISGDEFKMGTGAHYDLHYASEIYYGHWDIIKSVDKTVSGNSRVNTNLPAPFEARLDPMNNQVWQIVVLES